MIVRIEGTEIYLFNAWAGCRAHEQNAHLARQALLSLANLEGEGEEAVFAVSSHPSCAWIGSPCPRQCVHGASIQYGCGWR
jgi:hypothetical protein